MHLTFITHDKTNLSVAPKGSNKLTQMVQHQTIKTIYIPTMIARLFFNKIKTVQHCFYTGHRQHYCFDYSFCPLLRSVFSPTLWHNGFSIIKKNKQSLLHSLSLVSTNETLYISGVYQPGITVKKKKTVKSWTSLELKIITFLQCTQDY